MKKTTVALTVQEAKDFMDAVVKAKLLSYAIPLKKEESPKFMYDLARALAPVAEAATRDGSIPTAQKDVATRIAGLFGD